MAGRPNGRRDGPTVGGAALAPLILLIAGLMAGLIAGCRPGGASPAGQNGALTVFAAASLRDPLAALASAYERAVGVRLVLVTDSSTTLRTQLELGARADVYLSADAANPEALAAAGLLDGVVVRFAGTRLAVVVPLENPGRLASPFDLAGSGVSIVAAGDGVPITAYAAELVTRLAALPGAPPGFAAAYEANVVTRDDNAAAVLARIELGEGDAAIAYEVDATGSDDVVTLPVPDGTNVTAVYAGAVLAAAADRDAAHAFLDWLAGMDGQAILASFGFVAGS
jgi:molybdate transport system substrate-binding protein